MIGHRFTCLDRSPSGTRLLPLAGRGWGLRGIKRGIRKVGFLMKTRHYNILNRVNTEFRILNGKEKTYL